jgi:hypothetical protein
MAHSYDNRFHENMPKEKAWLPEQQAETEFPNSNFSISPLGSLTETLLATEEHSVALPGLAPLFLREALAELLEASC